MASQPGSLRRVTRRQASSTPAAATAAFLFSAATGLAGAYQLDGSDPNATSVSDCQASPKGAANAVSAQLCRHALLVGQPSYMHLPLPPLFLLLAASLHVYFPFCLPGCLHSAWFQALSSSPYRVYMCAFASMKTAIYLLLRALNPHTTISHPSPI